LIIQETIFSLVDVFLEEADLNRDQVTKSNITNTTNTLRNCIVLNDTQCIADTSSSDWYITMTQKIDLMQEYVQFLNEQQSRDAEGRRDSSKRRLDQSWTILAVLVGVWVPASLCLLCRLQGKLKER